MKLQLSTIGQPSRSWVSIAVSHTRLHLGLVDLHSYRAKFTQPNFHPSSRYVCGHFSTLDLQLGENWSSTTIFWRSAFNFVPNHMTDYYEVFTGSSTGLGCDSKCYDLRNYYMNVKAVFGDSHRINCAQLLLSTSCRATV